jgi:hypothetical protein
MLRLYGIVHARTTSTSEPAATAFQQALGELDPKLKEVLESMIFEFPHTHHD